MRAFAVLCAFCCTATAAKPLCANAFHLTAPVAEADTFVRQHFDIAALPVEKALDAFSALTGVSVRLAAEVAPATTARAIRGSFTLPEALRRMLGAVGLKARFGHDNMVVVVADAGADAPIYNLRPLDVVGVRNRGYSTVRSATATKTDTPLRDTPQSISVITRDVIADQSMQSMADVVRYIPGVTMAAGEGHRDAPTIRGNNSTADFFVDGVRDDAQYYRDLYNVERVEALKGSNAMIFGRGGGGGVINRVMKAPQWAPGRVISVAGGSFEHKRATADISQPISDNLAARLNGVYEDSRGFRDQAHLERYAANPTLQFAASERTSIGASYEFFDDHRTVDRGIPSFNGRPSAAPRSTYFGNPDSSYARARVHTVTTLAEHNSLSGITIRNRFRFADYDKFYQNSYASGAVNAAGTQVNLGAYNHATPRRNLFNQTDIIAHAQTGRLQHTLLLGAELGRQRTDNVRNTGYYNNTTAAFAVDIANPEVSVPIAFRQSATDADNRTVVTITSGYVQDQVALSKALQAVVGVRYDRFNIDFHNNRTNQDLARADRLLSPRAGLIIKTSDATSLYGSYTVSYLPSSGDQFSSLNATTKTLEPEQFTNYEVGGKWDVRANLSIALAVYQLDRTNTSAPDPLDSHLIVQTGSQRTRGVEANIAGDVANSWHVVAGASFQRAKIVSQTTAARPGASVALVPERTLSLWNRYNLLPGVGVGLGVVRQSDMFAAIDNTVTLPGFTRFDGALFLRVTPFVNAQINVENLLDNDYFATAQGNNNIMPGAPRTIRLTLTSRR